MRNSGLLTILLWAAGSWTAALLAGCEDSSSRAAHCERCVCDDAGSDLGDSGLGDTGLGRDGTPDAVQGPDLRTDGPAGGDDAAGDIGTAPDGTSTLAGVFYTASDLALWRQRFPAGPFKVKGDAFANSPGDWQRIKANAQSFIDDPDAVLSSGPSGTGPVQKNPDYSNFKQHEPTWLMCAAFVDLVEGTSTYTSEVKRILLAQAQVPRLDFTDSTIYTNGHLSDSIWGIAEWQTKLALAYDFVGRSSFTAQEQQLFEGWIEAGAAWQAKEMELNLTQVFDHQRGIPLDQYVVKSPYATPSGTQWTHWNGYDTAPVTRFYNNRRAAQAAFAAMGGLLSGNAGLLEQAKLFAKEHLAFFWYKDGAFSELHRSKSTLPQLGLLYGANTLSNVMEIAHYLHIHGDDSLFTFSTEAGISGAHGTASPGVKKSLKWAVQEYHKHIDGTYKRYAYESGGSTDVKYLLNPLEADGVHHLLFTVLADTYYNDPQLRKAYWPQPGSPFAFPSAPRSNGSYSIWNGLAGTSPGFMFMYAR